MIPAWATGIAAAAALLLADVQHHAIASGTLEYYREPAWQPRAHPTLDDLLGGQFHPAPPATDVRYDAPGFAAKRLHAPPAPGIHPRVLVTPADVETIRACVAQGPSAPPEFRALWERVRDSRSPFYALIARDATLGRALAVQFNDRVMALGPKIDRLDAQPDRQNLWSAERSLVASQDPDPPHELWTLLDYDYLHAWMTPAERLRAEQLIARVVKDRFSNYLAEPRHFMINNHKGFGMEFIRLMLLIEGKPDFPQETFRLSNTKMRAMLTWFLSPDGMCYESIKGWLNTSALLALGRRDPSLLRHSHLAAKMRFFQAALRWENGRWIIREEMRASAFHVVWMMRFLYPENRSYDFLYHGTLSTHPFLTDPSVRWPDPVGVAPELLLLFAGGGPGDGRAGKLADWRTQPAVDALKLPPTWKDDLRGYVEARNSWRIGDLHLGFVNKQDFYYGGHEGSEANRITLWKDGVNWIRDEDLLAVKATGLQNMLTINGRGLAWPPVPGVWLGVHEGPHGLSAAGDARMAYTYGKVMQVHPLSFPSGRLPYYAPFTEVNFDLTRDLQVAFHPGTVKFNDGYAHTDYGPWSGETRLVEHYRLNNPMAQAYRTVHLARGERPYVLLMDDARKPDDSEHLFEASFNLPDDAVVIDSKTSEVQFQNVEPSLLRESDFLIARGGTPRDPETGRPLVKNGDPLLLVRILHRNTTYGYPVPRVQVLPGRPERPFNRFTQLVVPAISRSPEFRILFYPHRSGDPLPVTQWNGDRSRLTVAIGSQTDTYQFARTDGGRTVFDFTRGGKPALANPAAPARPVLVVRGDRFDANELRTTRREGMVPEFPFANEVMVSFERPAAPAEIRYTLDGSVPTVRSTRYAAPFPVNESARLRARLFDSSWPGAQRASAELVARFVERPAQAGSTRPPEGTSPGLVCRVYEINTKMWDDRGFFRAGKVMLPDLGQAKPLATASVDDGFSLPHVVPAAPLTEQAKGFYRFSGWFHASVGGVYDFAVDSCGPVLLSVGGHQVITETGVFHQQQDIRRGVVVLGGGWHALELTVTDPLFWNIATARVMPFSVSVRGPGEGAFSPVPAARLAALRPADVRPSIPAVEWKNATAVNVALEPGVIRSAYERAGKSREPDYLEIAGLTPRHRGVADRMTDNTHPDQVLVYEGWFEAPVDGVYAFAMPYRKPERIHLGGFRSAYQSQLRISDAVVVQRGVAGRVTLDRIGLKAGWHPVSLRLGSSPAEVTVTYPDGQRVPFDAALLRRPAQVRVHPAGRPPALKAVWEINAPQRFTLTAPVGVSGTIRYTVDGSEPTAASPRATGPVQISETTPLRATVFDRDRALTEPVRVLIRRTPRPEEGLIADLDFSRWDGTTGMVSLDERCRVWVAGFARREVLDGRPALVAPPVEVRSGPGGVDINMTRGAGRVPLKLHFLKIREPEFTVGYWFSADGSNARLIAKQGLTAFGKSYRTISMGISNGRLTADPGRLAGGTVQSGRWHHAALSVTPTRLALYLDGVRIAEGPGNPDLTSDSFDLLPDTAGALAGLTIYNRELAAEEVKQLSDSQPK